MENNKRYLVKNNSQNYFCSCFNEVVEIIIGDDHNETPITNRFLLIEMIKIYAIIKGFEIEVIDSLIDKKKLNKNKLYLNIDDDDSIIEIINHLEIVTILYLI
ncbi:hypothetical protein [Clostridium perfringens]|uniref:hypothetical protein n=1 Tax=Clostridium perfringens TaxID=1502 RepID=UPI002446A553|nr:hypothetical protein [Clostridium perfringens]MDH2475973.1 hypothetical protein [Clostridium perfringens]